MIAYINAVSHFLVDAVCVCAMFSSGAAPEILSGAIMLYDTMAFSTQCLVGLALDSIAASKKRVKISGRYQIYTKKTIRSYGYLEALSMMIVAAGALLPCSIVLKAVIIGIGNSLFHETGGIVTLKKSEGKAAPLGVFVAPGAFGVTLGTLWPSTLKWVAAALIAAALVCLWAYKTRCSADETAQMINDAAGTGKGSENAEKTACPAKPGCDGADLSGRRSSPVLLPVILLTAAVAVRAIGGCAVSFSWKDSAFDAVLLTLFVFLGKLLGGFICDRSGAVWMSAVTITLAAVFTAFFAFSMPLSLAGQFLLNLSMPVTLWLLYRYLPDYPGLAFGLAASALWPGTMAGWLIKLAGPLQSILILVCFIFGLYAIIYSDRLSGRF